MRCVIATWKNITTKVTTWWIGELRSMPCGQGPMNQNSNQQSSSWHHLHHSPQNMRFNNIDHPWSWWSFWHVTSTVILTCHTIPIGRGGNFKWTVVQVISTPCHAVRGSVKNWFKMPSPYMILLQSTWQTMSRMFPNWSSHCMGNNWQMEGTLRQELIQHKVAYIKTWMEATVWETQV